MLKSIIRFGLFLLVAVVAYNYFYGTPTQKAQSQKVVDKTKNVFKKTMDAIKVEKAAFEADKSMDKLKDVLAQLKDKAADAGGKIKEELKEVELDQKNLEEKLAEATNVEEEKELQKDFVRLGKRLKELSEKLLQ